ncbi:MAG: glycosyltransferase family 39 protein [Patescibacteria group bacterium]
MLKNKIQQSMKKMNVYLLFIVILGALVRLAIHFTRDLWVDEIFTSYLMQQNWWHMFSIIIHDVHPPLYYILLKIWTLIFGVSPLALRSFSLIFGLALIVMIFYLIKLIFKNNFLSYSAAFIFAVNPFFADYSIESRTYMLSALLTCLTIYFFARAWQKHKEIVFSKNWLYLSICLGLLFLTHYVISVIIAINLLFIYIAVFIKNRQHKIKSNLWLIFKISIIPASILLLWLPAFVTQMKLNTSAYWIPKMHFSRLAVSTYAFLFGVQSNAMGLQNVRNITNHSPSLIIGAFILIVLLLSAILIIKCINKALKVYTGLALACWLMPIIIFLALSRYDIVNLYIERYFITSAVYFLIYVIFILSLMNKKLVMAIMFLYLILVGTIYTTAYTSDLRYSALATKIKNEFSASDNIYFTDMSDFQTIRYYLRNTNFNIYFYDDQYNSSQFAYDNEYKGYKIIQPAEIATSITKPQPNDIFITTNEIDNIQFNKICAFRDWQILTKQTNNTNF